MKYMLLILALMGLGIKANAQVSTLNSQQSGTNGQVKTDREQAYHITRDNQNTPDIDNQWTPGKTAALSLLRSCVWISSGTGLIDAIEVSSGVAATGGSGWAVFFDTADINGFTPGSANGNIITTPSNVVQIHLQYTAPMIPAATYTIQPRQSFLPPIPYTKGIVMCNSSADIVSTIQYRELRR